MIKKIQDLIKKTYNKGNYGNITYFIENKEEYKEYDSENIKAYYSEWGKNYRNNEIICKQFLKECYASPIKYYCGEKYKTINRYLRYGYDDKDNSNREMADILSYSLCCAPRIPNKMILYRAVNDVFIKKLIENNLISRETIEAGFMSTSLKKESIIYSKQQYATEFYLLKIYVNDNTIGVYVNAVIEGGEDEMLLCPNMRLGLCNYPYYDKAIKKLIFECQLKKYYL